MFVTTPQVLVALLSLVSLTGALKPLYSEIALRFPESLSVENYVAFTPNLTAAERSLSICGWLRKSRENPISYGYTGAATWFNYGVIQKTRAESMEILLTDSMREVKYQVLLGVARCY